jgi:diacylglycerol kinase family enzyme
VRVAVVINSHAGGLLGRQGGADEVARHLEAAGLDAVIVRDEEGDLIRRLEKAREAGVDAVVVGGGDGTIAAAAGFLAGTDTALGILPLGTMNQLAKDLRIPLDLTAATDALAGGAVRRIDVGEVNGRVFLCNSVLGFPSRLAVRREGLRGHGGVGDWWGFLLAGLRALYRYPPLRLKLRVGDERLRVRTRLLAVANNAYDEGLGQIMTKSHLDRGELILYLGRNLGVGALLRISAGMALGDWRAVGALETRSLKHLVVGSGRRRLRVMNDGEVVLMQPPLRYRVRPGALRVIVPREAMPKAEPVAEGGPPLAAAAEEAVA